LCILVFSEKCCSNFKYFSVSKDFDSNYKMSALMAESFPLLLFTISAYFYWVLSDNFLHSSSI
jgi:hypothetical protein